MTPTPPSPSSPNTLTRVADMVARCGADGQRGVQLTTLLGVIDDMRLHSTRDLTPGWVSVPAVEWDASMARADRFERGAVKLGPKAPDFPGAACFLDAVAVVLASQYGIEVAVGHLHDVARAAASARMPRALFERGSGWDLLDEFEHCEVRLRVYSRPDPDAHERAAGSGPGPRALVGWSYVVTCIVPDAGGAVSAPAGGPPAYIEVLLSDESAPWLHCPEREDIELLLVACGMVTSKPRGFPSEYALNVRHSNPFDTNFLTRTLRDRAVDEQFLLEGCATKSGIRLASDMEITTFFLDSHGEQDESTGLHASEWLRERWATIQAEMSSRSTGPAIEEA